MNSPNPRDRGQLDLRWPEPRPDTRTRRWAWVVSIVCTLLTALALAASVGDLRPRDLMFWRREQITYITPGGPNAVVPDTAHRDTGAARRP